MDGFQCKPLQRRISSVPLSRRYTNSTESTPILIAQLVPHLLPSPHFSLLVYMLAFFSQVALVREENGVGMEDLSRMFGGRIFESEQSRRRQFSDEIAKADAHEPRTEAEVMMCWFLRRWGPISESLFDVIEDAKMGVLQDQQQDRLRSLQKRCSVSVDTAGIPNHSSGRDTPFRLPVQDDVPRSGESPPQAKHDSDESPLKGRVNPKTLKNNNGSDKSVDYGKSDIIFSFSSW